MEHISLAGDFPASSEKEWLALAGKALAGAPFDALRTGLHEGIKTEPLYTKAEARAPLFASRGWFAVQPLTASVEQFNDDIANGAGALSIDFAGIPVETAEKLKYFLRSDIPYFVVSGSDVADAALVLAANGQNEIAGSAGFDPFTAFAISSELPAEKSGFLSDYVDAAFYIREHHPAFVPFLASGHAWNGAGGSATEELAFTLASAVGYWRALADAGMTLTDGARCVGFTLTASADIFLTIAKFRAIRLLWARALEAAEQKPSGTMLVLANMSWRILSAYDPHVNVLRGTAAAFGAAIGGASGINVLPFDSARAGATAFSRRLARNTSLILQQESYLSAVADAAAGSAYLETLTNELAAKAWALFRDVEARGGLGSCLESGFIHDLLRSKAAERARDVAFRRDKITGVSVFPNLSDAATNGMRTKNPGASTGHPFSEKLPVLPTSGEGERFAALVAAAGEGLPLSQLRAASRRVTSVVATPLLISKRDAEPFETLRRRADIAVERIGSRPPVFLALLGKPEDYRARATWVQGFFAAGGIEVIVPERGFDTPEAAAAAFKQSPAPVACLCSSNGTYGAIPGAISALKKAGAIAVYLAGPASVLKTLPQEDAVSLDRLIHEGCNALALLQEAQAALKVQELSLAADEEAAEQGFEIRTHPHNHVHGD